MRVLVCGGRNFCDVCGGELTWLHDHQPDNSGLDDGPLLSVPRKKPAPKSADETRQIRARAWSTRRKEKENEMDNETMSRIIRLLNEAQDILLKDAPDVDVTEFNQTEVGRAVRLIGDTVALVEDMEE